MKLKHLNLLNCMIRLVQKKNVCFFRLCISRWCDTFKNLPPNTGILFFLKTRFKKFLFKTYKYKFNIYPYLQALMKTYMYLKNISGLTYLCQVFVDDPLDLGSIPLSVLGPACRTEGIRFQVNPLVLWIRVLLIHFCHQPARM